MIDKELDKEANEKARKIYKVTDYDDDNASYLADVENYRRGFKDGAKFGYNNALQWHYPSKGELPEETDLLMSKTLLLVTKMKGSDGLFLALGKYNFSTQEFSYQHIVGLTKVIAWQYLPEPPKEM